MGFPAGGGAKAAAALTAAFGPMLRRN